MSTIANHRPRLGTPRQFAYLWAFLPAILAAGLADAQSSESPEPPNSAVTHVNRVDADFALLGEFAGTVQVTPEKSQPLALQVRPIGGGSFEAAQYAGGLPGERGHRPQAVRMIGKRADDFLVLSGGPWAVLVQDDHCRLIDRNGKRVGRLQRVHRQSPTMGAPAPNDATVLFDGTGTDQFENGRLTEDGLLMEGADLRPMFQDFNLHLEFMLPYMPAASGQGRSNSGVYLQSSYEVQVLDSFALEPVANGCAGLYKFREPDVNMCLPPLVWQTYDIAFTAPRWASDGTKLKNARLTVWHNGVKVHNDVELPDKTGAGKTEAPTLLPIRLQDHRNPVRFRNIWIVDRGASRPMRFPVIPKPADGDPKRQPARARRQADPR